VGEIVGINPMIINSLDENKFIPVIAPVGVGDAGETYNINADLVAGQLAEALGAEKLILLTDVEGVKDKKGGLLSTLKINQARKLIQDGVVAEGMIPKVECCIEALKGGVGKTHIIDAGSSTRCCSKRSRTRGWDGSCRIARVQASGFKFQNECVN
jgi:acetylglutamate kinase